MDLRYRHLTVLFVLLGIITACTAPTAGPQATPRPYRIGYLGPGTPGPSRDAFVAELGRLGYAVNQNLTIEYRWAERKIERLPELAAELVALNLDAIFASGEVAAQPLLEAGADVPIVMAT